jgi:Tfp pilus assembly protein PilN
MKRQLSLNLIQKSPFSWRYVNGLNIALLILAMILMAMLKLSFDKKNAALESQLTAFSNQMRHQQAAVKQVSTPQISNEELRFYQSITREMQVPWDTLLDALEVANQEDVYLLQVLPDTQAQRVTIEGKAKGLKEVLLYIDALSQSKVLFEVFLQRHEVNKELSGTPVDFTIIAKWHDETI